MVGDDDEEGVGQLAAHVLQQPPDLVVNEVDHAKVRSPRALHLVLVEGDVRRIRRQALLKPRSRVEIRE